LTNKNRTTIKIDATRLIRHSALGINNLVGQTRNGENERWNH